MSKLFAIVCLCIVVYAAANLEAPACAKRMAALGQSGVCVGK